MIAPASVFGLAPRFGVFGLEFVFRIQAPFHGLSAASSLSFAMVVASDCRNPRETVGLAPACFSLCRWQWLKPQVCIQRLSEDVLCQRKNRQTLFSSAVLPGGLKADPGLSVGPAGYPAAPTALEQSDPRRGGESPKLPTRVGSPARGPHI